MNIVTAVIVNTALETSAVDKEVKQAYQVQMRKSITEELGKLFEFYDEDNTGAITLKSLMEGPFEVRELLCKITDMHHVEDIFLEIDGNGDGELTLEEFCQGVLRIVNSELGGETRTFQTKLQTDFMRLFDILERLENKVDQGFEKVSELEQIVKRGGDSGKEENLGDRKAGKKDLSALSRQAKVQRNYKVATPDNEQGAYSVPAETPPQWIFNLLQELKSADAKTTLSQPRPDHISFEGLHQSEKSLKPANITAATAVSGIFKSGLQPSPRQGETRQDSVSEDGDHKHHIRFKDVPPDTGSFPDTGSAPTIWRPSVSSNSSPADQGIADLPSARRDSNSKSDISNMSETMPLIAGGSDAKQPSTPKRRGKLIRKRLPKETKSAPPLESAREDIAEVELRTTARPASTSIQRSNVDLLQVPAAASKQRTTNADIFSDSGPESLGSE